MQPPCYDLSRFIFCYLRCTAAIVNTLRICEKCIFVFHVQCASDSLNLWLCQRMFANNFIHGQRQLSGCYIMRSHTKQRK